MASRRHEVIRHGYASFFGAPLVGDISRLRADVAFLGVPFDHATNDRPGSRFGPAAIRDASMRYRSVNSAGWYDVERSRLILQGITMADVGDVDIRTTDLLDNFQRITAAVRRVRATGALPVLIGGDHSIAFPAVRAFDDKPLTIVQFDAHQDYTDERAGVRYSYDNQMRRIHELPFVQRLVLIGLRGHLENLEAWQAAQANGVQMVTAHHIATVGVEEALADLEIDGDAYLTIDIDVLDPSVAPGTGFPAPGGLTYYQLKAALLNVISRCQLTGLDLTEVNPVYDSTGITARTAAHILLDVLGAAFPSE